MITEPKVMEIYCIVDDFCKKITSHQEKHMIGDKKRTHRYKPNRMSDKEAFGS